MEDIVHKDLRCVISKEGKVQQTSAVVQESEEPNTSKFNRKDHWEGVYTNKLHTHVSWYEEYPEVSLKLIGAAGIAPDANIIDVGGGASTLVDTLLGHGYQRITVLDISASAMANSRQRLGEQAHRVKWLEADITEVKLPEQYDLWHDRAVFHFLTDAGDRRKYVRAVKQSLKPGGHLVVATFAIDGPQKCSGLDVVRYSPESLHAEFGDDFELLESFGIDHVTPAKGMQRFTFCRFRRTT
ncbi:class I SAM-dependent methyltransferase [Candidatus Magnetobacterium casense]|uniref:Class I SAM-dependent methyltransferase n=1 Tax=Candidatus Magnetobacterium casense TaxID=1455061 RepID=A0ABS6S256_9BACT|nr:class I SAM-dependent methyltransferase [Candidatus Magnetobacterium casensis]MBV6342920.1 class I SAM-dependent methyltransferase [Candidatus Magnetobacterium casensis]